MTITQYCKKHKISKTEFAKNVQISRQYLCDLENGRSSISESLKQRFPDEIELELVREEKFYKIKGL